MICAWVSCDKNCDNSNCWTAIGKVCPGCYNKEFCVNPDCNQVKLMSCECNLCYKCVPKGPNWHKAGSITDYYRSAEEALEARDAHYKKQRKEQRKELAAARGAHGSDGESRAGCAAFGRPGSRGCSMQQCRYDGHCNRQNPAHWGEYRHDLQDGPVPKPPKTGGASSAHGQSQCSMCNGKFMRFGSSREDRTRNFDWVMCPACWKLQQNKRFKK